MSNCKKLPYFEGLTDETIKQGSVFDPTEGVKAYDGYDEEIEYTYSPQELDTCLVGSQVIQYRASQTSEGDMLPNICIPDGLALALPSICDDYESTTAERIIHIIKANDPTIYGIPQVTVARGTAFNVLDGVTAVDDNGNPITDIDYSGTLDKEVSGDIVSIDDGDERYPVKSLEVQLEPIQDLNGYDKPWTGGAGKNKFGGTINQMFAVSLASGTTITVSAEVSGTGYGVARFYDSDETFLVSVLTATGTGTRKYGTLTLNADASYVKMEQSNATLTDIMIETGSTMTSYEPYSNICPISGHTECVTEVCGVNVWDEEWESGTINSSTGDNSVSQNAIRAVNYIAVKESAIYSVYNSTANAQVRIYYYDADMSFKQYGAVNCVNNVATFTIPSGVRYMRFAVGNSTTPITTNNQNLSINYPSTDHDYHAYDGHTYTTDLGRTVYGGTLDVVTGELVVTHVMDTFDGNSVTSVSASSGVQFARVVASALSTAVIADMVCNSYTPSVTSASGNIVWVSASQQVVRIFNDAFTDLATAKALLNENPVQLVYPLATPQTYQLDPQTISLLHGDNNVWSDGTVTMVYSVELPTDGEVSYPLEGEYEITYSATDKCGNVGEAIRHITVQ